jgi:hypothetical protein
MYLVPLIVTAVTTVSASQAANPAPSTPNAGNECFFFSLAREYERLGLWEKGEEYYLKAEACPDATIQSQLIPSIIRVRQYQYLLYPRNSALQLAREYEALGDWTQAEQQYGEAAKDPAVTQEAVDGIRRVKASLKLERWLDPEWVLGLVAKGFAWVLGSATVWMVVARCRMLWNSVSLKIDTGDKVADQLLASWFGHARAMLRADSSVNGLDLAHPHFHSSLPYISLPGLQDATPEIGDVEMAGVKFSLSSLIGLVKPRIQISPGWAPGKKKCHAYAEIEVRKWPLFVTKRIVTKDIALSDDKPDSSELELLAYEALIYAVRAHAS